MTLALRRPMTLAEFLDWEDGQELKYEFDGFGPIAMTGGTAAHSAIQRNLAIAIGGRLRGHPCQFHGNDLKIEVAGKIRYPDGFIVCSPVANVAKVVADPVVIFEVLSASTSSTAHLEVREYEATPSVVRYVILEQDRIAATVFSRSGGDFAAHVLVGDAILAMPEIGQSVPLAELYDGLVLRAARSRGGTRPGRLGASRPILPSRFTCRRPRAGRGTVDHCAGFQAPSSLCRLRNLICLSLAKLLELITFMTSMSIYRNIEIEMDRFDPNSS